ncbi:MAG: leucine-rich repeat domain-containing protein [Clostridia bacterium]|nr:leucine-rich repeat domain-containing protein [Clostridia bacterium]
MEQKYFDIEGEVLIKYTGAEDTVTVPDGIKTVGRAAFSGSRVREVLLPEGVEVLEQAAFLNCSKLLSVTLPDTLRSVGPYAFSGCTNLKEITFPEDISCIEQYAFSECKKLCAVTLPARAKLGNGLFSKCTALQKIAFPEGFTEIPHSCFRECSALTQLAVPEGVKQIGTYAFMKCTGLKELPLPTSLAAIGGNAFEDCTALESVTLSEGLQVIGQSAFSGCTALTKIAIPDSVTEIAYAAFGYCFALKEVSLPRHALRIAKHAFRDTPLVPEVGGMLHDFVAPGYLDGHLMFVPTFADKDFVVKEGTAFIDEGAFADQKFLHSVRLPESVREIGAEAFRNCPELTKVTLLEGLTAIGDDAFRGCGVLTKIVLPKTLRSIGAGAFADCARLRDVALPDGVTVGENAFLGAGLPSGFCRFDEAMNVPFAEIPEQKKRYYLFTVEGEDVMNGYLLGLDRFAVTPCDEALWGVLMDACNEWEIAYEHVDDFDPGDECGYAEPSREITQKRYVLYPENCLVRDGKVIGFTVNGERLLIGRLSSFCITAPTDDDRYQQYETYSLERRKL